VVGQDSTVTVVGEVDPEEVPVDPEVPVELVEVLVVLLGLEELVVEVVPLVVVVPLVPEVEVPLVPEVELVLVELVPVPEEEPLLVTSALDGQAPAKYPTFVATLQARHEDK